MHEVGYVEGHDFEMVFRFADGDYRRLPALADELVALRPSIFMTATVAGTLAIRKVTTTIPIVHPALTDPIAFGFIASLAQPGGQVTGLLATLDTLPGKQLQLALELVPGATRIGILLNASNPAMAAHLRGVEAAAATLAVKLVPIEARLPTELEAAFQKVAHGNIELLLVVQDSMFITERERIAALARIPTVYGFKEHVVAGGLISYGFNVRDNWRRAAGYVAKILKGAKPGDLPVELPTRLELVINLKTAKALGLTVPPSLLARADEVIE
jgi:putative ABC transport system substrate-binding protein